MVRTVSWASIQALDLSGHSIAVGELDDFVAHALGGNVRRTDENPGQDDGGRISNSTRAAAGDQRPRRPNGQRGEGHHREAMTEVSSDCSRPS